jgi:hypothetical protein
LNLVNVECGHINRTEPNLLSSSPKTFEIPHKPNIKYMFGMYEYNCKA